MSRNSLRNNLGTAIGQVVEQSKYTGERGGFIRLDARHTSSTTLTAHDFFRLVNGELLAVRDEIRAIKEWELINFPI